jgi:hypothetical protein
MMTVRLHLAALTLALVALAGLAIGLTVRLSQTSALAATEATVGNDFAETLADQQPAPQPPGPDAPIGDSSCRCFKPRRFAPAAGGNGTLFEIAQCFCSGQECVVVAAGGSNQSPALSCYRPN